MGRRKALGPEILAQPADVFDAAPGEALEPCNAGVVEWVCWSITLSSKLGGGHRWSEDGAAIFGGGGGTWRDDAGANSD